MNEILRINRKVLDYLVSLRKNDPSFLFVPRKINNKNRLNEGYWFIGNEYYLQLSFWNGTDWKEKINNIGFNINIDGSSSLDLTAQDSNHKADFLKKIIYELGGGFDRIGKKNRWNKILPGKDYMTNLKAFILVDKPKIDALIERMAPAEISLLDTSVVEKINRVSELRNSQIIFGSQNKISRLVWNTNNWKAPSGLSGAPNSDFKSIYKYGHEEWLFDRSRIIDGYQYGFIQPLSLKTKKHVNNIYNISLYTSDYSEKRYFVGEIKNVECISAELSQEIYLEYKKRGWYDEMVQDLKKIGANYKMFMQLTAEKFLNIRFKYSDVQLEDELMLIADDDPNITAPRYKLLPKISDFILEKESGDFEDQGNKKNTSIRRRITIADSEFNPYHDKMQNEIFELLKVCGEYDNKQVFIEKGRVDLKAKTKSGEWHYFELKTDSPKISIRKAMGQIIEYAFYPNKNRAKKLIIVSDSEPNTNDKQYIQFLRVKYNLPLFYRWYSFEKNELSADY